MCISYKNEPGSNSMVVDNPIFVTGFARSGTTWVNQLMRDYFNAGFANEGQFVVAFGRRLGRYGDLKNISNHKRLLHDLSGDTFFLILSKNYSVEIDWARVAQTSSSFTAIVVDILQQISEQMSKYRIGSKNPDYGRYLNLLNNLFPNCRVIHVIRDGRDCALSHKKMIWGQQNTYSAAMRWSKYLRQIRNEAEIMYDRYLEIRYEDLLMKPELTMGKLEKFIVGNYQERVTERFMQQSESLKTDKVGCWRLKMPMRSQVLFESVAGDMLKYYGYPITGNYNPPSLLFRIGYNVHNRMSREALNMARKLFKIPEVKQ